MLPLRDIEQVLVAKLIPPNEDEPTHLGHAPTEQDITSVAQRNQEVFVRPGPSWRGALSRARVHNPSSTQESDEDTTSCTRPTSAGNTGLETADEAQHVLHSLRKDMIQLWNDPTIREILRRKKIRLEETPGLYVFVLLFNLFLTHHSFLNDLERVTSLKYMPSDGMVNYIRPFFLIHSA